MNETQTQVDAKDLAYWHPDDLSLNGREPPSLHNRNSIDYQLREDTIARALTCILVHIVNYLAVGDSIDNIFPQDPSSPTSLIGVNQLTLLEHWRLLAKELENWSQELPNTFSPCARISGSVFSEIWFSIPMCASTMQTYHMARIILLINRPQESTARRTTLGSRLNSYRFIDAEVRYHSREICGIALGRTEPSARIHMIQPLFVAGQCLTELNERRFILDLLREIERGLGWSTKRYVHQLLNQWGWTNEARE